MSKVMDIKKDIKEAMKSKNKEKVSILRIVLSELENKKLDLKLGDVLSLGDDKVEQVLAGQLKKLEQEKEGLEKAGRVVGNVLKQREVLLNYLPKQLDESQLEGIIKGKMSELGVSELKEQGKLMGVLSKELRGKADMGKVSKKVRELLN